MQQTFRFKTRSDFILLQLIGLQYFCSE